MQDLKQVQGSIAKCLLTAVVPNCDESSKQLDGNTLCHSNLNSKSELTDDERKELVETIKNEHEVETDKS